MSVSRSSLVVVGGRSVRQPAGRSVRRLYSMVVVVGRSVRSLSSVGWTAGRWVSLGRRRRRLSSSVVRSAGRSVGRLFRRPFFRGRSAGRSSLSVARSSSPVRRSVVAVGRRRRSVGGSVGRSFVVTGRFAVVVGRCRRLAGPLAGPSPSSVFLPLVVVVGRRSSMDGPVGWSVCRVPSLSVVGRPSVGEGPGELLSSSGGWG